MGRTSILTPAKLKKLRALRDPKRKGGQATLRETAKELGIAFDTARRWEMKHGAKPKSEAKAKGKPGSKASTAVDDLKGAAPGSLEDVRARARIVRSLLKKLAPAVEREEYPATNFVTLLRYADELDRLLFELSPAEPKDPETDPDVREAERALLAKLEMMIRDAERKRARA